MNLLLLYGYPDTIFKTLLFFYNNKKTFVSFQFTDFAYNTINFMKIQNLTYNHEEKCFENTE